MPAVSVIVASAPLPVMTTLLTSPLSAVYRPNAIITPADAAVGMRSAAERASSRATTNRGTPPMIELGEFINWFLLHFRLGLDRPPRRDSPRRSGRGPRSARRSH